jgi:hypothetical protein
MSILTRLFHRSPRYDVSAYGDIYSALKARLDRPGVRVGGTAGYPRVEIHSIREGERQDKDGALRVVTLTVESISKSSLGEAVAMNDGNLRLLTETELEIDGWDCLGVIPTQLQDLSETSDSAKILYRILQEVSVFLEKVKTDTGEEDNNDND